MPEANKRNEESKFSKLKHNQFESEKYQSKKTYNIKIRGNENLGVSRKGTSSQTIKKTKILSQKDSKKKPVVAKTYRLSKSSEGRKLAFKSDSIEMKRNPHYKVKSSPKTFKKAFSKSLVTGIEKAGSVEESDQSDLSESTTTSINNATNKFVSKKTRNKLNVKYASESKYKITKQNTNLHFKHNEAKSTKLSNDVILKNSNVQKKGIQKFHARKFRDVLNKETIKQTLKQMPKQVGKLLNEVIARIFSALKAMTTSINSLIVIGVFIVFMMISSLLALFGFVFVSSISSQSYSLSSYEATQIQQMFAEREMKYLEMLVHEVEEAGTDAEVNYEDVGHEPHQVIALVQVIANERMEESNSKRLTSKMAEEIISEIFEARYSFSKYTRTITTENSDGNPVEREVTTLISRTTSFENLIFGGNRLGISVDLQEFIDSIGPTASKIADENNLYASVMIAQAILESGGSQLSELASPPYFNLFGIKGSFNGNTVSLNTKEDDGSGNMTVINDGFRDYNSYEESMMDYASVLSHQRYIGARKSNATTYQEATAELTGKYATDTQYDVKLNNIIQNYKLIRFDNFSEEMLDQIEDINFSSDEINEREVDGNQPVTPLENMPTVSSGYDYRTHPITGVRHFHAGLDFPAPTGTPVLTVKKGVIADAGFSNSAGHYVFVQLEDGYYSANYHLSEILVQKGDAVEKGDVIGLVGSTGNSTGPHLHFEIVDRIWGINAGGTAFNPGEYLQGAISVSPKAHGYSRLSLTTEQREEYEQYLNTRGMLGGYQSPIKNYDWGKHVVIPWGVVWNEDENTQYFNDRLSIFAPQGSQIVSQIGGTVEDISESEEGLNIIIKSKDTITIEYGNLTNLEVNEGDSVHKGELIGELAETKLIIRMNDSKTNDELNPQIMMFTEYPTPLKYKVP